MTFLRCLLAAALAALLPLAAAAQSSPGLSYGQVPSAGQWNSYFAAKVDLAPGGIPVASGGTGATTSAQARTNLGLAIGTNVEAWGKNLDALAGLAGAASAIPYFTGAGAMALAVPSGDCTAASMVFTCTRTAGTLFAPSATVDTTNAANITSGTLPAGRLPAPTPTTLGGVESFAAPSHQWVNGINASGAPTSSQPGCGDLSNAGSACQAVAPAGAIVGTTDAQTLTNKSIDGAEINSGLVAPAHGGTGVNNGSATLTLGGAMAMSGAYTFTGNLSGNTNVTFPTSGTLANTANISSAIPSATTSQIYGGTGSAGAAQAVTVGSGLTLSGGTLSAASSGLTLISTQTASNTSPYMAWTGLGTTYNNYILRCFNITGGGSDTALIQFGEGAGPTWETSGYEWMDNYGTAGSLYNNSSSGAAGIDLIGTTMGGAGPGVTFDVTILNIPTIGTNPYKNTTVIGNSHSYYSGNYRTTTVAGAYTSDTNPKTAIRLTISSNIAYGTCSLYGISN